MKNRRAITAVIVLAALFSLVFTQAYAEESGGNGEVINGADSVYYNDGETVFNNYGTVYNNSGKVYNNAGTVFNNGGTVYNNGGRVFNNAGIVYNNGGEVVSAGDGGTVYEALPSVSGDTAVEPVSETNTDKAPSEPAVDDTSSEGSVNAPDGKFRISLAGEYADFAYIEGCDRRDGDYLAGVDDEIVFTPKPGFTISGASSTTGRCSLQEDGSIVFSGAERDGMLTLGFTVDAPVFHPDFGTYGEAQTVKIIVPNGVTVYYSTDGSEPVGDSGKVYEGPITVESSTAFQIAATADGAQSSGIIFGRYLIPLLTLRILSRSARAIHP